MLGLEVTKVPGWTQLSKSSLVHQKENVHKLYLKKVKKQCMGLNIYILSGLYLHRHNNFPETGNRLALQCCRTGWGTSGTGRSLSPRAQSANTDEALLPLYCAATLHGQLLPVRLSTTPGEMENYTTVLRRKQIQQLESAGHRSLPL